MLRTVPAARLAAAGWKGWNKMAKKRFFPALLLTLVLALSLTPISAFADGVNYMQKVKVAYTHIGYKAGDTPRKTASVTEGNCCLLYTSDAADE